MDSEKRATRPLSRLVFAVIDKVSCRLLAVGKFHHHETQHVRKAKRKALLYKLVDRIEKLANHYDADVIVGKMQTTQVQGKPKKARRKIRQMPQHQFRHILAYRLTSRGIHIKEYSEAYTSIGGQKLSPLLRLDVHKCAAILFALKVTNYEFFQALVNFLQRFSFHDGCGSSLRLKQPEGSLGGLTALIQNGQVSLPSRLSPRMRFWMTMMLFEEELKNSGGNSEMPGIRGLSFVESLKSSFASHSVKIC
ncbi:MAG: IS200/IS605 family accessory protein TnpB-related protein [Candidatus Hermodarchaeota archaeon]